MSRYDNIEAEISRLRTRRAFAVIAPAFLASALITVATYISRFSLPPWLAGLATLVVAPFIFDWAWRGVFAKYRHWCERSAEIVAEIVNLRGRIDRIYEKYPERRKGEQFKRAYGLAGMSVHELETTLSVGMYREGREVFVTAFMRAGVVVRVTASIGSPFRCAAADDPSRWATHVEQLLCDEIRQYHNHPEHNGKTEPSPQDSRSIRSLKAILHQHGNKLRSFIICWNQIREWRLFEYDHDGRHWLLAEFDAAG